MSELLFATAVGLVAAMLLLLVLLAMLRALQFGAFATSSVPRP